MQSDVLVSVIVPVYNTEKYLSECLESICAQTLDSIEIIVVDDGSTDKSLTIAREYALKDLRISVLSQEKQNAGAARNLGLAHASGFYLSFIDADDFIDPKMLKTMVQSAQVNNSDIVICRSYIFDDISKKSEKNLNAINHIDPNIVYSPKDLAERIFSISVSWARDKLFRKDFITKNELAFQNQSSINDAFFVFLALSLANRIVLVDDYLIQHRVNNPNSTEANRHEGWKNSFSAIEAIEQELKKREIFSLYENSFLRWIYFYSHWNTHSISKKTREEYFQKVRSDLLSKLQKLREIDDDWGLSTYTHLLELSHCEVFIEALDGKQKVVSLQEEKVSLQEEIASLQEEVYLLHEKVRSHERSIQNYENRIEQYEQSSSYRLGRLLTKPCRIIRSILERKTKS